MHLVTWNYKNNQLLNRFFYLFKFLSILFTYLFTILEFLLCFFLSQNHGFINFRYLLTSCKVFVLNSAISRFCDIGSFSWNWLISFLWNIFMCYRPIWRCCVTEPDLFGKIPFQHKWAKMVKWPKVGVLGLFRKIYSNLFFLEMVENKSIYEPLAFFKNCICGKNLVLKLWQNCSWSVEFHFSLIINISLMEWHLTLILCM